MDRTESGQKAVELTRESFVAHLREALNHLQDPAILTESPLAALFGVADRFDTFTALQDILMEAIDALEPSPDEPPQSRAWRMYESLYYRYHQQLSQQEIADQMGLGPRQVRREQLAGMELLADHLYQRYDLAARLASAAGVAPTDYTDGTEDGPSVDDELAWVEDSSQSSGTNLASSLGALEELAKPLVTRQRAHLTMEMVGAIPEVAVHHVALNQMLLDIVCAALDYAKDGEVTIKAFARECDIAISISATGRSDDAGTGRENGLGMARRLACLSHGTLQLEDCAEGFRATLIIPARQQVTVLVIDDNADMLRLVKRYAAGTRYQIIGLDDPDQALDMACQRAPHVIVLDVMMPQTDGWQVLRMLRAHPATTAIPIIVCSIVGREELAYALGANECLRKPVTRRAFLDALAQQVRPQARGSD